MDQRNFELHELDTFKVNTRRFIKNVWSIPGFVFFKNESRPVWMPEQSVLRWIGKYEAETCTDSILAGVNPMMPYNHTQFMANRTKATFTPSSIVPQRKGFIPLVPPSSLTYTPPPGIFDPMLKLPKDFKVEYTPKGCQHEWSTYQGFTDTFEYCTKCDEKR